MNARHYKIEREEVTPGKIVRMGRQHFTSVNDIFDYATTAPASYAGNEKHYVFTRVAPGNSWLNYQTIPSLRKMMTSSPTELLAAVQGYKDRLEQHLDMPTKARRKRTNRQGAGDELDPIAWVQRDPEGWSDTQKIRTPKNTIRLGINLSTTGAAKKDQLIVRGAAVAALADILTARGNSVEVVAFDANGDLCSNVDHCVTSFMVKPMDAPLDLASMVTCIAELGFFRIIMLGAMIKLADFEVGGGIGTCAKLPAKDAKDFDIICDWSLHLDQTTVENFILEQLKRFPQG
jgi:hypothetical protein